MEVAAAGVNYMDIYQREGVGNYRTEPPFVPGAEGAGTVVAVGSDVKDLAVGDHVAWAGQGSSYAEQVALSANRVVPVPDGMNLQVAAAGGPEPRQRAASRAGLRTSCAGRWPRPSPPQSATTAISSGATS